MDIDSGEWVTACTVSVLNLLLPIDKMKQELQDKLYKNFPKLFAQKDMDMKETCMCWGFECGNGWFTILDQLMSNIQHHIDWNNKNFEKGGGRGMSQRKL